jgi:hypothetical protein
MNTVSVWSYETNTSYISVLKSWLFCIKYVQMWQYNMQDFFQSYTF